MKKSKRNKAMVRFSEEDSKAISQLNEIAKERFFNLSKADQRKYLQLAKRLHQRKLQKEKLLKQAQKSTYQKKQIKRAAIKSSEQLVKKEIDLPIAKKAASATRTFGGTLQALLTKPIRNQTTSGSDSNEAELQTFSVESKKAIKKSKATSIRLLGRLRKEREKKKAATGVKKVTNKTVKGIFRIFRAFSIPKPGKNSLIFIIGFFFLLVVAVIGSIGAVFMAFSGEENNVEVTSYEANVTPEVEKYRELVEKYCNKYQIDGYVDLVLAIIQQESAGKGKDIMQSYYSYFNTSSQAIKDPEQSVDYGVHQFSDCLSQAACKNPNDIKGISLALQGYNYGNGYINWAVMNYHEYTPENAIVFSEKMCNQLHMKEYGDREYVPHVLKYYIEVEGSTISNEDAAKIVKVLKEHNEASPEAWKTIEKGASLVGKVTYSMESRQDDGRDTPTILDCSSFVAWCFHKSGHNEIPYVSNTSTFINSSHFETILGSDLQPGDIGLKSATAPTGGANHVGIYCGKLPNGNKIWIHCTSSCGTSLTGNSSGVLMNAYTNFTYFRRLKSWK